MLLCSFSAYSKFNSKVFKLIIKKFQVEQGPRILRISSFYFFFLAPPPIFVLFVFLLLSFLSWLTLLCCFSFSFILILSMSVFFFSSFLELSLSPESCLSRDLRCDAPPPELLLLPPNTVNTIRILNRFYTCHP